MSTSTLIDEFLELCHSFHRRGFVSGTGGNVSVRCGKQFLITPSGVSLRSLRKDDLVLLSQDGTFFCKQAHLPSKEWRMHLECYQRSDVNAVVHVHSTYATAVSCLKELDPGCAMPVYTPGYGLRVGALKAVAYERPGSEELARLAGQVIRTSNSVIMKNHGILAVGAALTQAADLIEEIEENAHLMLLLGQVGNALTEENQADLSGQIQADGGGAQ